jgi:hypothetical protein
MSVMPLEGLPRGVGEGVCGGAAVYIGLPARGVAGFEQLTIASGTVVSVRPAGPGRGCLALIPLRVFELSWAM